LCSRANGQAKSLDVDTKFLDVRAVLFDFDFKLADPSAWLIAAWVEALAGTERTATKCSVPED
jgi:hypothetical protein